MSARGTLQGDIYVNGTLQALTLVPSASCVLNSHVSSTAAIDASKLVHQHQQIYAQNGNVVSAADRRVVHVAIGAGEIISFKCGVKTAAVGNSTVTVDLKSSNTSVLSSTVTIDSGDAAYALVEATVTTTAYVADAVLEVVVTVSAGSGTLPYGIFAVLEVREAAA